MTDSLLPKVFISYSWQPPEHQQKIIGLAKKLMENGVHVFLDVWDLQEGQDSYAFMERMINNPEITRVLIIMNKSYTDKANNRQGGVGTETQIISGDIYKKIDQTKFIPLSFEKDDKDNHYIPTFLINRIFIDFTNDSKFEESYEKLLRNIFNERLYTKPALGTPPKFVSNGSLPIITASISTDARIDALIIEGQQKATEEAPIMRGDSVELFAHRISKSFPGVRGTEWFNSPSVAVDRLMLLLRQPLTFRVQADDYEGQLSPIWWFRAGSSMMIEEVERISSTKILMDGDELEIKKIGVFESPRPYLCFVYVETTAETQTGIHNYTKKDIDNYISYLGYANEEYGLLGNTAIKRTEYDDGAAIINGEVVDASEAVIRTRYLTDYNFIICANGASFNSRKFDIGSKDLLNGILKGTNTTEQLFEWMKTFRREDRDR